MASSSEDDFLVGPTTKRKRVTYQEDSDDDFESTSSSSKVVAVKATKKKATETKKPTTATVVKKSSPASQKKSKPKKSASSSVEKSPASKKKSKPKKATVSPGKTSKATKKTTSSPVKKPKSKTKAVGATVRKLKVHGKAERLDMAIKAYRWWDSEPLPEGVAWRRLEHNGVVFPPDYVTHGIPMRYNGHDIVLNAAEEELASFYAAIPKDGPQLDKESTATIFNANFFKDFTALLSPQNALKITQFDACDFSAIKSYLDQLREAKKALTKEEKAPEKELKQNEMFAHGFSILDAHVEKVGNFRIEPPGLFRGRGEHPKTGTFKTKTDPEQVTINIGVGDRVPPCHSRPGHAWEGVVHRDSVTWLATWNENVMNGTKYVWLAASSSFKGKSDVEKYDKARDLKGCIDRIRKNYRQGLDASDLIIKQRSTAMWVIDILALRVGGEKTDDEADTVGCCSLRVEHMDFSSETPYELTLAFLGKDSMPYHNTIEFAKYDTVGKKVYDNLKSFCHGKTSETQVFTELSPSELNKHLSALMPGLTAKVFRTFNASSTLQKELPTSLAIHADAGPKVVQYNDANRKVAILCNHQRTVSKSHDATVEKMQGQLALLTKQLKELKSMKRKVVKGEPVTKLKSASEDPEVKKRETHLFPKPPTVDAVGKKIASWEKKAAGLTFRVNDKEDNKEVALGTSKINYMDPRITVAWCKRNEVPIAAVFAKTLREKFVWAMAVKPDWTF